MNLHEEIAAALAASSEERHARLRWLMPVDWASKDAEEVEKREALFAELKTHPTYALSAGKALEKLHDLGLSPRHIASAEETLLKCIRARLYWAHAKEEDAQRRQKAGQLAGRITQSQARAQDTARAEYELARTVEPPPAPWSYIANEFIEICDARGFVFIAPRKGNRKTYSGFGEAEMECVLVAETFIREANLERMAACLAAAALLTLYGVAPSSTALHTETGGEGRSIFKVLDRYSKKP